MTGFKETANEKDIPHAKKDPFISHLHGDELIDYYHWLRDSKWPQVTDPEVLSYLKAENAYYQNVMGEHKDYEDKLYNELVGRIKLVDESVPIKKDNYFYYIKSKADSNYFIHCRKHESLTSQEEILLDENILAQGHEYFRLGFLSLSPDHNRIAYGIDTKGNERYTLVIKNLSTGEILPETIDDIDGAIWHENNKGFFYTKFNENWRTDKVYYHQIGTLSEKDKLIFQETDNLYRISISKSGSKEFLYITISGHDNNEIHTIDLSTNDLSPKVVAPRKLNHKYYIEHHDKNFYIATNDVGKNFRLVVTPTSNPNTENWHELLPHSPTSYLTSCYAYKDFAVVTYKENGLPSFKIYGYDFSHSKEINFPESSYTASLQYTTYDAPALRLSYSSLNTPRSIIEYDFSTFAPNVLKVDEIPSGYDKEKYNSERIFAEVENGTKVPISLVYKKDLFRQDGANPLYLYGYGSYGYAIPPSFNRNIISLLDQGFVYAIAHIRGGDDLGYEWYESAKFLNKKRTFSDFIASAQHLINQKYTSKGNIVISGGSAGGMLIGVAINEQPELFKAAVADVPFVDVLNTMLDESLPLTPGEFKEWGNPKDKAYYDYIKSYSPYDNIKKQDYPILYVTAGISDPRVTYWEPAKWVAKLREYKTDNNLLFLETNMDVGHGGASGRFGHLRDVAKEYCFIFKAFDKIEKV